MARRANICTARSSEIAPQIEPCSTADGTTVLAHACIQAARAAGSESRVACAPAPGRGDALASSAAAARLVRRSPRGGMRAPTWPDQGQGWRAQGHGSDGPVPRRTARASEASSLPRPQPGMQGAPPAHAALPTFGIGVSKHCLWLLYQSCAISALRYTRVGSLGWLAKKKVDWPGMSRLFQSGLVTRRTVDLYQCQFASFSCTTPSGSVHVPRKTTSGGEQVAAASSVLARSSATTAKGKRARQACQAHARRHLCHASDQPDGCPEAPFTCNGGIELARTEPHAVSEPHGRTSGCTTTRRQWTCRPCIDAVDNYTLPSDSFALILCLSRQPPKRSASSFD